MVVTNLELIRNLFFPNSLLYEQHEDSNPMTDVVDRVNDIYGAVVQSEECMERIACELGGLASDLQLKTPVSQ